MPFPDSGIYMYKGTYTSKGSFIRKKNTVNYNMFYIINDSKKEKQDVDNMKNDSKIKDMFKDQSAFDKQLTQEQVMK